MNAAQLLAHFDRISEAPDAVPRLRRFILDLAVRGKLVPQDPKDEPAEEVLRRERKGWREPDTGPFTLPASWVWARVGDIAEARLGKMLDRKKNRGTPRRYLRNINVRWFGFDLSDVLEMPFEDSELDEFAARDGDVLICEGGQPGRAAVWDGREKEIYFQKALHRLRFPVGVNAHYFVKALRAGVDSGRLDSYFTGVTFKHLTGQGLSAVPMPVPPLAEQRRIVAKVDDLLALCDRLEAAQAEREGRRDRLLAASLQRLSQPDGTADAEAARRHARFHLQHLQRFTTRREHVQQLRRAILDLAVRGRLFRQDPHDEPAAQLLQRIEAEKEQLIRAGTIGRRPPVQPVTGRELVPKVPRSWLVVRAGDLLTFVTSGSRGWAAHYSNTGSLFLRIGNLDYGTTDLDLSDVQRVTPPKGAEGARTLVREGDILVSITGDTGMIGLVPAGLPAAYINQHIALVRPSAYLYSRYLATFLTSPSARAQLRGAQRGIKNSLGLEDIRNLLVPLPPLAEQHRIVARVDELLALCGRLEGSLESGTAQRRRCCEALLQRAFGPAA